MRQISVFDSFKADFLSKWQQLAKKQGKKVKDYKIPYKFYSKNDDIERLAYIESLDFSIDVDNEGNYIFKRK